MEQFIDEISITVESGKGGAGAVSFRREAHVPRGGPDGGDGGKGGDVIFICDKRVSSFLELKRQHKFKAPDGEQGKKRQANGADAKDLMIRVPVGTVILDAEGNQAADLTEEGASFLAAAGGLGGKGNPFYASSTNQSPDYAQHGMPGEERSYKLEIKMIADIGLVGFPNAGKSTLLSVLTRAHPKIASYPFTTLVPNLGVCYVDVDASFIIADIPGIIEGAHDGVGLGFQFLKHIERTGALAYVMDVYENFSYEDYEKLRNELKLFSTTLAEKEFIAVFNKIDLIDEETANEVIDAFEDELTDEEEQRYHGSFAVSGVSRAGLKELSSAMLEISKRQDKSPLQ